jgi:hypothetical protein
MRDHLLARLTVLMPTPLFAWLHQHHQCCPAPCQRRGPREGELTIVEGSSSDSSRKLANLCPRGR